MTIKINKEGSVKAKITQLEATANDMHDFKGHARITRNPFFTSVWPSYSSRYPDYTLMVLKNSFKNHHRVTN